MLKHIFIGFYSFLLVSCSQMKTKDNTKLFVQLQKGMGCEYQLFDLIKNTQRILKSFEVCPKAYAFDSHTNRHLYSDGTQIVIETAQKKEEISIPKQDDIASGIPNEVLWFHHNEQVKLARENYLKYSDDYLVKRGKDNVWLIKYDSQYYANGLSIGSPTFYEIFTLKTHKKSQWLSRSFGEVHGSEFDEAIGLRGVISSNVNEKYDTYSFAHVPIRKTYSSDKIEGSLDKKIINRLTKKLESIGAHSLEFVKTKKGGFVYGNASDGYTYLKSPVYYIEGDSVSELISKGRIYPQIYKKYLILNHEGELKIYSRASGKLVKVIKNIGHYRIY